MELGSSPDTRLDSTMHLMTAQDFEYFDGWMRIGLVDIAGWFRLVLPSSHCIRHFCVVEFLRGKLAADTPFLLPFNHGMMKDEFNSNISTNSTDNTI